MPPVVAASTPVRTSLFGAEFDIGRFTADRLGIPTARSLAVPGALQLMRGGGGRAARLSLVTVGQDGVSVHAQLCDWTRQRRRSPPPSG